MNSEIKKLFEQNKEIAKELFKINNIIKEMAQKHEETMEIILRFNQFMNDAGKMMEDLSQMDIQSSSNLDIDYDKLATIVTKYAQLNLK